jgi:hypothetical protein
VGVYVGIHMFYSSPLSPAVAASPSHPGYPHAEVVVAVLMAAGAAVEAVAMAGRILS